MAFAALNSPKALAVTETEFYSKIVSLTHEKSKWKNLMKADLDSPAKNLEQF